MMLNYVKKCLWPFVLLDYSIYYIYLSMVHKINKKNTLQNLIEHRHHLSPTLQAHLYTIHLYALTTFIVTRSYLFMLQTVSFPSIQRIWIKIQVLKQNITLSPKYMILQKTRNSVWIDLIKSMSQYRTLLTVPTLFAKALIWQHTAKVNPN